MGDVVFKNPNKPNQPKKGVYRWSYKKGNQGGTLCIGQAGGRGCPTVSRPSTLGRGLSELQRTAGLSSNKGHSLDTDFVVGTLIRYLHGKGTLEWRKQSKG